MGGWRQDFILLPVTLVSLFILALVPFTLQSRGFSDANRAVVSPILDVQPSVWQSIFGARSQLVFLSWLPATGAPFKNKSASSEGYLLGDQNGITAFFSLNDCTLYRLPSAAIVAQRAIGSPGKDSGTTQGGPKPSKPHC
jgi:hypothetical protein